jgi:topoisomerase-4 subunit A
LLVFPLDELKLQPNGGRGLTLMDLDGKDPLLDACPFTQGLLVIGTGLRGSKPKEEMLRPAALAAHQGKRARKGKVLDGMKAQRLQALA